MLNTFFNILEQINDFIWGYIGFLLIFGLGIFLSIKSRFFQIRKFPKVMQNFFQFLQKKDPNHHEWDESGVHPIKVFFAAIGGCIGIGNIVGICTAVQIGGPGALFWTWIAGLLGMLIQYSEVYLGMIHRVKNKKGEFMGGPMYFLPKAYKGKWVALLVSGLLALYGVELFMFNVITDSISTNWALPKIFVVVTLLFFVLYSVSGGIRRVGDICSAIIPIFILLYSFMSLFIILQNLEAIPSLLQKIFSAAFTPQAAYGAFAGSTVMLTISMGLSRGAYSGDLGVGYTSVIHCETKSKNPQKQASLTIFGIFLDTFVICTFSILLVLLTGTWKDPIDVTLMVQNALSQYFPYMDVFMPFFLFLLGFTTIISYFAVGLKCMSFLWPKRGKYVYYLYAIISLPLFAFVNPVQAFTVMSLAGATLLMINITGMFLLRREVKFRL